METYIVRQPILDESKKVVAYEILYQQGGSGDDAHDFNTANTIEAFLTQINTDTFLDGKQAYLTFTPKLLLRNIPRIFAAEKLIIQIEDDVIVHPLAQKVIYRYKSQGYRIAIKGFEFSPRYFGILDVVDIIKVDFATPSPTAQKNIINIGTSFHKEIVAYNVNTREAWELAQSLGCKCFQGNSIAEQSLSKVHRMDHMQSNFFQLMLAITNDQPNLDEIAMIISRDVTLAFSLMKLVNSAYFALRNRAKSVKQALIILGLGQLKQWIYLLSFKQSNGMMPEELIKTSFLRGSFCAELSQYVSNLPISKSEAYLLGMFSTLGALLEVPLESALSELPVCDEIKSALISGEGMCGTLYQLILAYENADWHAITSYAEPLGIPLPLIAHKYFECVESVNITWRSLMSPYESQNEDGDKFGDS